MRTSRIPYRARRRSLRCRRLPTPCSPAPPPARRAGAGLGAAAPFGGAPGAAPARRAAGVGEGGMGGAPVLPDARPPPRRKLVTVLAAELAWSTELADRLDVESLRELS